MIYAIASYFRKLLRVITNIALRYRYVLHLLYVLYCTVGTPRQLTEHIDKLTVDRS